MECRVTTSDATFVGRVTRGTRAFSGIRYANCERFGEPAAHAYGGAEVQATEPSPFCPQNANNVESFIFGGRVATTPQQEDALFLNVTTPENATGPLPVMVWIHGGAFKSGGASGSLGDPTKLVVENNVVVVAINYRLGFYGFVRNTKGELANLGMLDMIQALQWVTRNIAAFGGDPENVTIFGQSAGGSAVQYLLTTECAGVNFQRAIIQSSCFGALTGREAMDAHQLSIANGITREMTMEEVLAAEKRAMDSNPEKGNAKYCAFAPRPGYAPLPKAEDLPAAYAAAAKKVELLIGCGQHETALYAGADPRLRKLVQFPLTRLVVAPILDSKSRQIFSDGARQFAQAYANAGGNVFFYDFSWGVGVSLWGGCHCSDVPLVLEPDNDKSAPIYMNKTPEQITQAATRMRAIWATFAREGRVSDWKVPSCIAITKVEPCADDSRF